MAKRKHAAALFEVIHTDRRFTPRRAIWSLPSPLAWLRRRSADGDASAPMAADDSGPRPPSPLWNLLPRMPRLLLDADRHVITFKLSVTTALVSAFAVLAAIVLAFVVGRQTSRQQFPALAHMSSEELRSSPPQPQVLDVGPEGAPVAMVSQQRPTVRPAPPSGSSPGQIAAPARTAFNDPQPPTTLVIDDAKRVVNMNYVIVQSYPEQEKRMAEEACALLNRRGVPCDVIQGLYYAPNWHVIVGKRGFDRVSSPEYEAYVRRIEQISLEFAGTSKFKKFEPRAFRWQEPKR
jgi:hypothetical protein